MVEIIRVATNDQILLTADLAEEIWREHYTPIIGVQQVQYMLRKFQSHEAISAKIDAGELIYFLIYHYRKPAGYFAFQLNRGEIFLSKLYVKADERQQGLAKRALAFIKNVAAENCLKKITLIYG
jgi:GNAT superfamily N-acetyltransferase